MKFRILLLIALTVGTFGLIAAPRVFADDAVNVLSPPCQLYKEQNPHAPLPAACQDNNAVTGPDKSSPADDTNPIFGPHGILTGFINLLSIVTGIAAVIALLAAGLRFVTSGSNPQEVKVAREMILYASVGLFVGASAQVIVRFWLYQL